MSSTLPNPKTPSGKVNKPVSNITPAAKGSGSNHTYETRNKQEDYRDYLEADLEGTLIIPFVDFLDIAFALKPTWRTKGQFETIATSHIFQRFLKEYEKITVTEMDRYHPFNKLVNHIIEILAEESSSAQESIVFCRNDHMKVEGSYATRIPDCVVVSKKASEDPPREGWESMYLDGPIKKAFYWSELLAFVEFKVTGHVKSRAARPRKKAANSGASSRGNKSEQLKQSDAPSTCMFYLFLFQRQLNLTNMFMIS